MWVNVSFTPKDETMAIGKKTKKMGRLYFRLIKSYSCIKHVKCANCKTFHKTYAFHNHVILKDVNLFNTHLGENEIHIK